MMDASLPPPERPLRRALRRVILAVSRVAAQLRLGGWRYQTRLRHGYGPTTAPRRTRRMDRLRRGADPVREPVRCAVPAERVRAVGRTGDRSGARRDAGADSRA